MVITKQQHKVLYTDVAIYILGGICSHIAMAIYANVAIMPYRAITNAKFNPGYLKIALTI